MHHCILLRPNWQHKICHSNTQFVCVCSNPFATHCNALQHTATHCNATLHHNALHCNTLQHTATHCNTLQIPLSKRILLSTMSMPHTATHATHCTYRYRRGSFGARCHYNTLQHTATPCSTLQHTANTVIEEDHLAHDVN